MTITAPASSAKADSRNAKKDAQPRSHIREGVETIVFVVTLVLLLKLFIVEAFVIPTGSMAETLYGYQKIVTCSQCKFEFPVNAHDEVEGNAGTKQKIPLSGYCCPNCRWIGNFTNTDNPSPNSGDRVLVLKPIYHVANPQRGDVVVFKYPEKPEDDRLSAQNYIKRAMGFGGETIAIFRGELFATRDLTYPESDKGDDGDPLYPRPESSLDIWKPRYMYSNAHHDKNPLALGRFNETWKAGFPVGDKWFQIIRKTDDQVLACERIVWDNEHQPEALKGVAEPRWQTDPSGRALDDPSQPKVFTHSGGSQEWIRYQNLLGNLWTDPANATPTVVRNFLGYNGGFTVGQEQPKASPADEAWVGDLIIECEIEFAPDTEVVLELSRSIHRYQATFSEGNVALSQTGTDAKPLSTRPSGIKDGKHRLRFANVDSRLRVWVDGSVIDFGGENDYPPVMVENVANGGTEGWTKENDELAPASIGVKGAATVRKVTLWRDIYYTPTLDQSRPQPDFPEVYYVQPGDYMCLGDNGAQSSDSRMWGTVPERLLLGKAVFVFWPFSIEKAKDRIGFIK